MSLPTADMKRSLPYCPCTTQRHAFQFLVEGAGLAVWCSVLTL